VTCTWCKNEAIEAGQIPINTRGPEYLFGCELHANKIKKLKYEPVVLAIIVAEISKAERKERAQTKT
jgi:hypothetical protein